MQICHKSPTCMFINVTFNHSTFLKRALYICIHTHIDIMRLCVYIFHFLFYFNLIVENDPVPAIFFPPQRNYECISPKINISSLDAIKIFILGPLCITLLSNIFLQINNSVRFIKFTTNLSTKPKFSCH